MGLNAPLNRKLRMGLVGGGQGSFIGRVHSIAAVMDHRAALVAGALSSDPAKAFAEAGFNVMCDKPLTFDLAQAEELAKVVQKTGVVFGVTHNYTGYPLVRQARDMVRNGELGEINAVRAFYIQGWLRTRLEKEGQKQAGWSTDPKRSGAAGCFGDIGTHAYNIRRFITGLLPDQISCHLKIFEPGRALDDYGV